MSDINGDLHTHTNWTDGTDTLEDMAKTAKARGYEYMALTDHTQNLAMTRGLTPERLEEERALVKRVNQKLAPFVVLLGTEMDILMDGQLDFSDDVLRVARLRLGIGPHRISPGARGHDRTHAARHLESAGQHAQPSARAHHPPPRRLRGRHAGGGRTRRCARAARSS